MLGRLQRKQYPWLLRLERQCGNVTLDKTIRTVAFILEALVFRLDETVLQLVGFLRVRELSKTLAIWSLERAIEESMKVFDSNNQASLVLEEAYDHRIDAQKRRKLVLHVMQDRKFFRVDVPNEYVQVVLLGLLHPVLAGLDDIIRWCLIATVTEYPHAIVEVEPASQRKRLEDALGVLVDVVDLDVLVHPDLVVEVGAVGWLLHQAIFIALSGRK